MDDAVGHPVEEFGSAESQRYLRQDSLPVISGPQIARIRNIDIIEGSLEVKLPTIWTDEKQRWEESEKRREEERRSQKRKPQKKEVREKVGKSRNTVFFQWFVAPEGRKVGSLKRRVRSQLARWEMKNCTPLWHEPHFQVKMYKAPNVRTTFGSCDVEKVHAVVARSTFRNQHVKKHQGFGPPLDVQMSFGVAGARDWAPCQKWATREGFVAFSTTTTTTPRYAPTTATPSQLHSITLNYTTLHYTTLHSTKLHYATLQHTTLHYIPLHYITLHYTTLHYIPLHYTTLHYTPLHYTQLRYTTLHYTTLHYIPLHYTTLHCTALHYSTLHYTALHDTTRHYTTLHYTNYNYSYNYNYNYNNTTFTVRYTTLP